MANDVYSSLLFRKGTVSPEKANNSWKFCLIQWPHDHLVCVHWSRNRHPHEISWNFAEVQKWPM